MILQTRNPHGVIAEEPIALIASDGHETYRIQTEGYAVTLTAAEVDYLWSLRVQAKEAKDAA